VNNELVANISLLFAELPYLDRFAAARDAGFDAVETWWPFESAVPPAREVSAFLKASETIPVTGLNLFAGDMPAGERGLVCRADREDEFLQNIDAVLTIAEATGCRGFNALFGQYRAGEDPAQQYETGIRHLVHAVQAFHEIGGTVYIEPLTRGSAGAYPIVTARDAVAVVAEVRERSGLHTIGFLFDTFHLSNNGERLLDVIDAHAADIVHVQLADAPDRSEPGSGRIDFAGVIDALRSRGYPGRIAAEYSPTGGVTSRSLGWMRTLLGRS